MTTAEQLRLILLGVGLALIGGLWLWERRHGAQPSADSRAGARLPDRFAPQIDADAGAAPTALTPAELPTGRAAGVERRPAADPPLVTLADLPEDLENVTLRREAPQPPPRLEPALVQPAPGPPPAAEIVAGEPPVLSPDAVVARPKLKQAPPKPPPELPKHQRIVAIRVVAPDEERINGAALYAALGAEGLTFGRYSIFHRLRADGRALYSVASLVEPGSFDPARFESMDFPGISLFAVFPGPVAAPQAFDELLAAGRRLAERLGALLQDDSGSSLTGQRVISIREELVHFEHLLAMTRPRPQI